MKRVSLVLGLILALAGTLLATAPTELTTGAIPFFGRDTTISAAATFGTVTAGDSLTLFEYRTFSPEREYVLVRDAITGNGSDSVALRVVLRSYDENKNLLYSTDIDSFTTAAGEAVMIPLGTTQFGRRWTIKLIGYTGNGGAVVVNRLSLWWRQPITMTKNYR